MPAPTTTGPAAGAIKKHLTERRQGHDANQLLLDIMDEWGGTRQFAKDLFAEFKDTEATSYTRQNILEMIQKLIVNNTNHNLTRIVNPTDLDDEEIEAEIQAAIQRSLEFERERAEAARPHEGVTQHAVSWEAEEPPHDFYVK